MLEPFSNKNTMKFQYNVTIWLQEEISEWLPYKVVDVVKTLVTSYMISSYTYVQEVKDQRNDTNSNPCTMTTLLLT